MQQDDGQGAPVFCEHSTRAPGDLMSTFLARHNLDGGRDRLVRASPQMAPQRGSGFIFDRLVRVMRGCQPGRKRCRISNSCNAPYH